MQTYNNSNYKYQPKIITGVPGIGEIPGISEIKPVPEIKPVRKITTWTDLQKAYDYAKKDPYTEKFIANYNDPTELNSYLDALVNRKAVSKEFGDAWGTFSTISGAVSVLAAIATVVLTATSFFTYGATAPGAVLTAKVAGGTAAGAGATAAAAKGVSVASKANTLSKVAKVTKTISKVAAIPAAPAAAKVTYNYGIQPIIHGKPEQALLNSLMNFSETMDYAANPVKGLVMEGPEGFLKATGLTDEGRVNYNYDTGFFLTDMILEIASDVTNWLDWVTPLVRAGTVSKLAIARAQGYTDYLKYNYRTLKYGDTVVEISDEGFERIQKRIHKVHVKQIKERSKLIVKGVSNSNSEKTTIVSFFKNPIQNTKKIIKNDFDKTFKTPKPVSADDLKALAKRQEAEMQAAIVRALTAECPDLTGTQIATLLSKHGRNVKTGRFTQSLYGYTKNFDWDKLSLNVINGLTSIKTSNDAIQKFFMKHALMTSGYGFGVKLVGKAASDTIGWMYNNHITRLLDSKLIDKTVGLKNLANYEKLKNEWGNSLIYHMHMAQVGASQAIDPMDSFYTFMTNQFAEDQQLIRRAIQDHVNKPIEQAAALDAVFTQRYNIDFKGYIEYLRTINASENDLYGMFAKYAEQIHDTLMQQGVTATAFSKQVKKGAQLYAKHSLLHLNEAQTEVINTLQKLMKASTTTEITQALYTIKLNDYAVNAALVYDPVLSKAIMELNGSEGLGALLDNISTHARALVPEANAKIMQSVRDLKRAAQTFINMRDLFDNIAALMFTDTPIKADDLKRYIIDQIFGLKGTIPELLASFDNTTMPELIAKLETFLIEYKFKVDNYPMLREQIAGVLKSYLEAQHNIGVTQLNKAIADDFTQSVNTLTTNLTVFSQELAPLRDVAVYTAHALKQVQLQNDMLMQVYFADKNTIFKAFNTRQLSDAGLALKTVATVQNISYFDIPKNASGLHIKIAEKYGQRISDYLKRAEQLGEDLIIPNENIRDILSALYVLITESFTKLKDIPFNLKVLNHLKPSRYILETIIHLHLIQDCIQKEPRLLQIWKNIYERATANLTPDVVLYLNKIISNPHSMLVTNYAWDAMRQAAFYAERELNETMINVICTYDNLTIGSRKMIKTMQQMRTLLTTNKADLPKIMMLERYSKAAKRVTEVMEWFQSEYAKLFDHKLATKTIDDLRKLFINYPTLYNKYRSVIDELEAYWSGTKTFRQDPKFYKNRADYVDEFTPFWKRVKDMNRTYVELQRDKYTYDVLLKYIQRHNPDKYTEFVRYMADSTNSTRILQIFNDHTIMTDESVYQEYVAFLKEYVLTPAQLANTDKSVVLNIELIPNGFKNILYDYIATNYYITDVNLTYMYAHGRARRTSSTILINPINDSIQDILDVVKHECAHVSLNNVPADLRTKFLEEVNTRVYGILGEKAYKMYCDRLLEIGYKPESLYTELHGRASGNDIVKNMNKRFTGVLTDEQIKALQDYAQELQQQNKTFIQQYHPIPDATIAAKERLLNNPDLKDIQTVTPWDPIKKMQQINQQIKQATDKNAFAVLYKIFDYTPEQLKEELAFRKRFITFTDADLNNNSLKRKFETFKSSITPETGIRVIYDNVRQRYWFILDKNQKLEIHGRDVYLNGKHLIRTPQSPRKFDEFKIIDESLNASDYKLTNMLNTWSEDLETLTGSKLGDSQGEFFSKDTMMHIFDLDAAHKPLNMSNEVWEAFGGTITKNGEYKIDIDNIVPGTYFQAYTFNESILGGSASKAKLAMVSDNLLINAQNSIGQAHCYAKTKAEVVDTFFDSTFRIDNLWKDFTDEELLKILQNTSEYKLVALVGDKKYGARIQEILPLRVEHIAKAREIGAIIVPEQTYKTLYTLVNHRLGSAGLLKIWNRLMYVFKTGYLIRIGAWTRNWLDTNLKTYAELGPETRKYQRTARILLEEYEKINDYLATRAKDGIIRKEALQEWFKLHPDGVLNLQAYNEITETWFEQSVSGGIAREMANTDAWHTMVHYTGKILDATSGKTESINRLAIYLADLDKGLDLTSALSHVSKTHFDYSFKTIGEQIAEALLPFSTYSLRNFSYWAEALDKHPWLLRLYTDIMGPHWDFSDYTPEELAANTQIQRQILNGQLKIAEFNNKVLTFKMNPSIQDALTMFTQPINAMYEKLAAPIAAPIAFATNEYYDPTNLMPIVGPMIQDLKQTVTKGNPIPSLTGVLRQPRKTGQKTANGKWSNPNLSGVNDYRDKQYRVPRYRNNNVLDPYYTFGKQRYSTLMYPIIDIAHDIKMQYSINVYNKIKSQVTVDVQKDLRNRMRIDANRFRK